MRGLAPKLGALAFELAQLFDGLLNVARVPGRLDLPETKILSSALRDALVDELDERAARDRHGRAIRVGMFGRVPLELGRDDQMEMTPFSGDLAQPIPLLPALQAMRTRLFLASRL